MKSSTYLNWLRRLIVLGAVVAGIAVPAAGAFNGSPPDVRDAANSIAGTSVGSPPDIQDAAAALHFTSRGLTADGLRLQGTAQVYKQLGLAQNAPTPQGIKADGLRLQGIAQTYKQIQSVSSPDVFERYATAHPYGVGLSEATSSTLVTSPPDVRDAAAAANLQSSDVFERYAKAHPYGTGLSQVTSSTLVTRPPDVTDAAQAVRYGVSVNQSSGFDWGDYAIGIGTGMGLILILASGLVVTQHRRHRMLTA